VLAVDGEVEKQEGLPALHWQLSGKETNKKGCRPYASGCREGEKQEGLPALCWQLTGKERSRKGCKPCAGS
jgi:hypothetical protein